MMLRQRRRMTASKNRLLAVEVTSDYNGKTPIRGVRSAALNRHRTRSQQSAKLNPSGRLAIQRSGRFVLIVVSRITKWILTVMLAVISWNPRGVLVRGPLKIANSTRALVGGRRTSANSRRYN